ncbi:PDR/VanB family oxidoreductase [Nocardia macrotermitis]|uniref:Phenoxybenzoate dioxygenase subunit beta n=1 Tax=Nocardia macrotermitis TaxID=2585198 RepID=A0A7K0CZH8_9NOCA|nr:PDR/VanB family oxidoreductase [Nocardia macrotermitis]MQY18886.1 Phenoxybenzoate dioxygenase subunit beta [Nocardia macrotermitis]
MGVETLELVVRQLRWEAREVVSVRLEDADGATLPDWTPGAHIDLHLGNGLIRQYSLCGDPADKTGYRVAVHLAPDSRGGSRYVHDGLRVGRPITISLPRNNFELLDAPSYLFLAGGIGITPLLGMIGEAQRRGADWELHYGGRTRAALAFLDELLPHGDRVHVVSEDCEGRLDLPELLGESRSGTLVYSCGPEGMLGAVEQLGAAWPEGTVRLERFAPTARSSPTEAAGEQPVRVVCQRSGITATAAPGCSILDTLEEAGVDVPSSCREGICGSCETTVLQGVPDHRDDVLSSAEQTSGKTMMICVSRALTDELVLDL